MRDRSGTGQVYRFTLSQLLKSRANRVTLIIMVLLAAVSMPLTALLGGETPETSDTASLTSVRVDNRTDLALDFSGDAYWADTDFSADAGEPDAVVTVTGDESGYLGAVNGSEAADAGELSQLAETARQAVRDACRRAAGGAARLLEVLSVSSGVEDGHEEGFWVQYGYSILAMILCMMSASYVIRAVVEEKDSRLVELLLEKARALMERHTPRRRPAEWALRWLWNQLDVTCVLAGMNSLDMVEEYCRVAAECRAGEFGPEEETFFEELRRVINEKMKVGCTGCGYCLP